MSFALFYRQESLANAKASAQQRWHSAKFRENLNL